MTKLLLSGAGGSSNWFPLLFPLLAILAIVWLGEYLMKYIKAKKLERENKFINQFTSAGETEISETTEQTP